MRGRLDAFRTDAFCSAIPSAVSRILYRRIPRRFLTSDGQTYLPEIRYRWTLDRVSTRGLSTTDLLVCWPPMMMACCVGHARYWKHSVLQPTRWSAGRPADRVRSPASPAPARLEQFCVWILLPVVSDQQAIDAWICWKGVLSRLMCWILLPW